MEDLGAGEGTAAVERSSLEGKTILVVEKEPLIALDLQRALEAAGAEVTVAQRQGGGLPHQEVSFCSRRDRLASLI
jgi:hypothetical protein